jgi:hypothetical protein
MEWHSSAISLGPGKYLLNWPAPSNSHSKSASHQMILSNNGNCYIVRW